MTRFTVILVIVSALSLGIYCLWKGNDDIKKVADRVQNLKYMSMKATVVYARRDIEVGSLVSSDSVEQRTVMQCQIPGQAICNASDVIGRRPIYGIEKGQVLSIYDFLLPEQEVKYRKLRAIR
ncbi:hypothetical protein KBI23_00875 [bacterium]|jgi:Flp pilus assembly protein CpaB|nr:hypothetical protein [bacterium]MBP9089549.1 hypothetical protein [bacterium]MBP9808941.1 hypothetical protein [bacterium]